MTKMKTRIIASAGLAYMGSFAALADSAPRMFAQFDTDQDGRIAEAEVRAVTEAKFAALDTNGDKMLTLEELPQEMPVDPFVAERGARKAKQIAKRAARNGIDVDEEQIRQRMAPTRMKFMARMDKNGDEQVSFDEFSARAFRMFERVDSNADKYIDQAEADAAREKMQKRRKRRRS